MLSKRNAFNGNKNTGLPDWRSKPGVPERKIIISGNYGLQKKLAHLRSFCSVEIFSLPYNALFKLSIEDYNSLLAKSGLRVASAQIKIYCSIEKLMLIVFR